MRPRLLTPFLILAGLAVVMVPLPVQPTAPQERTFRIEAQQFAYSPSEIHVNPGDSVRIELVSLDVVHGLYIDGYDLKIEADPGQTKTLSFIANQMGSYRFRCNISCGAMHPFMVGRISVGRNEWLFRSIGLAVLTVIGFIPAASYTRSRLKEEKITVSNL